MKVPKALASCLLGTVAITTVLNALPASAAAPATTAAPAAIPAPPAWLTAAAAAAPFTSAAALSPGSQGTQIQRLQRALIARGFAIPAGPTGYFGPQTQAAVAAFQRAQGWRGSGADGLPGPKTLALLGVTASAPAPAAAAKPASLRVSYAPGSSGAHIVRLQQSLIARGFAISGGATGLFGPQTRSAIAAFQRSQGWRGSSADGVPGTQTLARLGIAAGVAVSGSRLSPTAFVAAYGSTARQVAAQTGVPALVILGTAALESAWGASAPAYNFFGIKASAADPPSRVQWRVTTEVLAGPEQSRGQQVLSVTPRADGRLTYVVRARFRAYPSADAAFQDFASFLRTNSRYRPAFQYTQDPYRFASAIAAAGYATAPGYAGILHSYMQQVQAAGWR